MATNQSFSILIWAIKARTRNGKVPLSIRITVKNIKEEEQDKFKNTLTTYVRTYSFLSQIMPFQDVDLEKLYSYGRFLLSKIPKGDYTERFRLDNEVALEYYRLQKIGEGDLVLQVQGEQGLLLN